MAGGGDKVRGTIAWMRGVLKRGDTFPGPYGRTHIISPDAPPQTLCGLRIPSEKDVFEITDEGRGDCRRCTNKEVAK